MLRHAKPADDEVSDPNRNADATSDIDVVPYEEESIFAKQTHIVRMKDGYHLFIFHESCARVQRIRFGEPFLL